MLSRALGLRTSLRAVPRVSRRGVATAPHADQKPGFGEVPDMIRRIPVDVYPLLTFVTLGVTFGFIYMGKVLWTDQDLRRRPSHMLKE